MKTNKLIDGATQLVLELFFFYQGENKDKNKEKNYILKDTLLITSAETILTNCKTEIVLASIFIFSLLHSVIALN